MWAAHNCGAPPRSPEATLPSMSDERARFMAAAHEIARLPGVVGALRAAHVAGPDGRCRGCPSAHSVAPHWPCRLRLLADRASAVGSR